jgi:hypothetical protein
VAYLIDNPVLIRSFLADLKNHKSEIRLVAGLVEHIGFVTETGKESFSVLVSAPDAGLEAVLTAPDARIPVRVEFKKYYFSFDSVPLSIQRPAGTPAKTADTVLKLSFPSEMQRSADRALRVRPMQTAHLTIPQYSMKSLRHEAESFFRFEEKQPILAAIDEDLARGDEWSLKDARTKIEEELRRLTAGRSSVDGYKFVSRTSDKNNSIDRISELWILDSQKSGISTPEKEHYAEKGIGSLAICVISNQFLQRDAFLLTTRSTEQRGITQPERDYLRALGRRLHLATTPNRQITFDVRDLGEDGLSFTDPEGHLASAEPGTILRDVSLRLYKDDEIDLNAAIVRSVSDLRAVRTEYLEFSTRQKVRNFVMSTLRLKTLTGKIY